jgi:hypothetical protein
LWYLDFLISRPPYMWTFWYLGLLISGVLIFGPSYIWISSIFWYLLIFISEPSDVWTNRCDTEHNLFLVSPPIRKVRKLCELQQWILNSCSLWSTGKMTPVHSIVFSQLPQRKPAKLAGAIFRPEFHHPVQ